MHPKNANGESVISRLFVAATVLLSGWQGVRSLLGMGFSLVVIVGFIVPQILAGWNPVLVAIAGSVVMMGVSLYLVYGWNRKTHVAVAGLFVTLVLTGLLAYWYLMIYRVYHLLAYQYVVLLVHWYAVLRVCCYLLYSVRRGR